MTESIISFYFNSLILQILTKLISFLSSQYIVKLLPPELFGIWSVKLGIIFDTVIFWGREGVRKAAIRSSTPKKFMILPLIIGIFIAPLVYILFRFGSDTNDNDSFNIACIFTIIGGILVLAGDIWSIPQLAEMNISNEAKIASAALFTKSLVTIFFIKKFYENEQSSSNHKLILCFGLTNVAYGVVILMGYMLFCKFIRIETPTLGILSEIRPIFFQSIIQWFFSQGERLILLSRVSTEQLGIYAFVSDLLSIVVRIVFAPLESSAYTLLANSKNTVPKSVYFPMVHVVTIVSLFSLSFGPSIGGFFISKLYSSKWNGEESSKCLTAYCRVMPFMALNGITEAFANARLGAQGLLTYNFKLTAVSVLYFVLMFFLAKIYGNAGAIYANGVNMCIRSGMALNEIFKEIGFDIKILPNIFLIISLIFFAFIEQYLSIKNIFIALTCYILLTLLLEYKMFLPLIRREKKKKE